MAASDTSSEENFDLLKEAVDDQFINDSMFSSSGTGSVPNRTEEQEKPPSLRPKLDKEQHYNELHVTPEFQAFVAKHLVKTIDRQLVEFSSDLSSSVQNGDAKSQISGGVRLFGSSSDYLCAETMPSYKKGKRKTVQVEDEDELEKCKTVAVTPEWIISRTEISSWKKSEKGELLIVNESGDVIDHKGAKPKIKTNSWGVRDDTFHIDVISSAVDIIDKKKEKYREKRKKQKQKNKLKKMINGNDIIKM